VGNEHVLVREPYITAFLACHMSSSGQSLPTLRVLSKPVLNSLRQYIDSFPEALSLCLIT
jgi:hypothetical protein